MRNNKFLKALLAGALVLTVLASAIPAAANEPVPFTEPTGTGATGEPVTLDELVIRKDFTTTPGTTLPEEAADRTFDFQMRYHSAMIGNTVLTNNQVTGLGIYPSPATAWTPSTSTDAAAWRNVATVTVPAGTGSGYAETADLFAGVTWPTAGEFTFYIREVTPTPNPVVNVDSATGVRETRIYDETIFRVVVQVVRDADGDLIIGGIAIWDAGAPGLGTEAGKVAEVAFNNRFLREIPNTYCPPTDPDCEYYDPSYNEAGLRVSKTVTGDGGDTEQLFDFSGVITNASDDEVFFPLTPVRTYRAWIYEPEGSYMVRTGDFVVFTHNIVNTFQLRHGQELRFEALPVGTQFVFTETNAHAHDPSVIVTVNGEEVLERETGSTVTTGPDAFRTGEDPRNEAAFFNNRTTAPLTGLLSDNLPFVLVGIAAVGFIGLLATSRRRRAYEA